jgi:transposase
MWYSGIDQHKQYCVITTYGSDGPSVKQGRVASAPLALQQYFAEFPGPHRAVVESTGSWYWLADVLAGLGVALVLAHATRVKAISAAKVKTDQVDSDVLALLFRGGLIPAAHMIRPEQRGPRDLMRTRLRLVEKCVSAQNSIDRLLEKFNLATIAELDTLYQLQAACHTAQMELLETQITTLERALHPHLVPHPDVHSSSPSAMPASGPSSTTRKSARSSRPRPGAIRFGSRARSSRSSSRASSLSRAHDAGRLQRAVQEPTAQSPETRAVATPGKPTRLTESAHAGSRA